MNYSLRVILLLSLSLLSFSSASAQLSTPPFTPPPTGTLNGTPPCEDPDHLPPQAQVHVPCSGILLFRDNSSKEQRATIIQEVSASLKFNYDSVNAASVSIHNQ